MSNKSVFIIILIIFRRGFGQEIVNCRQPSTALESVDRPVWGCCIVAEDKEEFIKSLEK